LFRVVRADNRRLYSLMVEDLRHETKDKTPTAEGSGEDH
jgi:Mg2+/Co2+ transporter CorC